MSDALNSVRLETAFRAFRANLPPPRSGPPKQFYNILEIEAALVALKRPLAAERERGGLINPWALASLKDNEVRNAAALAGLWMAEFGGETSKLFLAAYLSKAIAGIDWGVELDKGYRVETEVCPLGDTADRVDLVIETSAYLIGVEVKIRAGLGPQQLERYHKSISERAELQHRQSYVVLLSSITKQFANISTTSWSDIANAARQAAGRGSRDKTFVQQLVTSFGAHVQKF